MRGVIPDIILPDNLHYLDIGENEYDHALPWTEIEPVEYNQEVARLDHITEMATASKKRILKSDKFSKVLANAQRIKDNKDQKVYPLNMDDFIAEMNEKESEAKQYMDLYDQEIENLLISNLEVDTAIINADESKLARNEDWIKGIRKDFYLEEALYIMKDMITKEESFANIEAKLDGVRN